MTKNISLLNLSQIALYSLLKPVMSIKIVPLHGRETRLKILMKLVQNSLNNQVTYLHHREGNKSRFHLAALG